MRFCGWVEKEVVGRRDIDDKVEIVIVGVACN